MTAVERSAVRWGGTEIAYAIRRSARRGTVSIAIDARDGVQLTAPEATPVERLDRLVRAKAPWIARRLSRQSELPPPPPAREFITGETFRYLGRQYRLHVDPASVAMRPLVLSGGRMHVAVPRGLDAEHRARCVRAALKDWYRRRAIARLPDRVAQWARRLGVADPRVVVCEQRKRWASCHPSGVVRFNWRIVQTSTHMVDYVVAHELVHIVHHDHSRAFWSTLGRVMPDYERRRAELRAAGPAMEW